MEPTRLSSSHITPVDEEVDLNFDFDESPLIHRKSESKISDLSSRRFSSSSRSKSETSESRLDVIPDIGPKHDLSINEDLVRVIGLMLGDKTNPPKTDHVEIKIRTKLEKDATNKPNLQKYTKDGKSGFKIDCTYTIEIRDRYKGIVKTQAIKRTLFIGNVSNNDPGRALQSLTEAKDLFAGIALHVVNQPTQLISPLTQELTRAQRAEGAFARNKATGAFEFLEKEAEHIKIGDLAVRVNKQAKANKKYRYQTDQKVTTQYDEKADKALKISDQKLNQAIIARSEKIELAQSAVQNQVTLKTLQNNGTRVSSHIDQLKQKMDQLESRFNRLKTDQETPFVEYRIKPLNKWEKDADAFKQVLRDSQAIKKAEAGVFSDTTGVKLSEKHGLSSEAKRYIHHLERKIDIQNELNSYLEEQKLIQREAELRNNENEYSKVEENKRTPEQKNALKSVQEERAHIHKEKFGKIFDKYPGKIVPKILEEINASIATRQTELTRVEQELESDHKTLIEERSQNYISGRFKLMVIQEELESKLKHIKALKQELEATQDARYQFDIKNLEKLEKHLEKVVKEQKTLLENIDKQMSEVFI